MRKMAVVLALGLFAVPLMGLAQTPEQEEQQLRQDAESAIKQGYDYFVEGALENANRAPASIAKNGNGKFFKAGSQPDEALSAELVLDLLNR
ncbi:hypothetical protein D3C87_1424370 [compost metagenome]